MPLPMVPAPTTVTFLISIILHESTFQDDAAGFAATDAYRGHAASGASAFHRVHQCHQNPCSARTDRMTKGDGAAMDVHLAHIKTEHVVDSKVDNSERFIYFKQVNIV